MSKGLHNPHPDFKSVEATRPEFDSSSQFHLTKVPSPSWAFGSGANAEYPKDPKSHAAIDPHEDGRPIGFNYKLLISSIIPRPIAFISTISKDGKTQNLAPFSYFNFVNHDPPILVVGFASGIANAKDTLRNVLDSESAVINIISETFLEAANSTSINAPYGVSEWEVAGLTPVYDCETVKAPRVKEAVFSVEVKVDSVREFDSRATPGKKAGTMVTFEGTRFWVREDALNEEKNLVDPAVSLMFP
jgi:flavin reductase (DIM6/NTAB) family NADH-FMN oxidoreductase RutF